MGIILGIDIGTVSIKMALLNDTSSAQDIPDKDHIFFQPSEEAASHKNINSGLFVTKYTRIKGDPVDSAYQLLRKIMEIIPADQIKGVRVCGSGGKLISEILDVPFENELRATAFSVGALYPDIATILEIGGQNSKYIGMNTATTGILDYEKSSDCAAGTGSFLDQQALRLKFDISRIGEIVSHTEKSAKIAGRCSVFAKSDMIHAQQKGYTPEQVLKGLCESVARNFKSGILKGKKITTPALLLGGVAINTGVVDALRDCLRLSKNELIVPGYFAWMGAIGAALIQNESSVKSTLPALDLLSNYSSAKSETVKISMPLSLDKVLLLRDEISLKGSITGDFISNTYLGVDVGSVSTNVVVIDEKGNVIKQIYTPTDGRPIEVVDRCLKEINQELGSGIRISGVGTTGSGRELIGELIGSDTVNDEITAHKTGAEFIAQTMLETHPDTIFEIGGQDSKYISIENGVVTDFAMNEACAAGTGSFLEERSEELGISIKGEFARYALASSQPIKLGERCTVFMGLDVASHQQQGVSREDLTAGLAYSIVYNYLNRVVGRRKIGDVIFFQGGTAYNDAIAAAFATVLGKKIIVPPYNGVIGAVGAALLAREKTAQITSSSKFRGFSLESIDYDLKEFTCKACSNYCHMQEFTVEGEKTFWGDQCSDKFRRRQTAGFKPVINDLFSVYLELLFDGYIPHSNGQATIGLPRSMYIYEQFPFWNTFFSQLGYRVILSDETNIQTVRVGAEYSVADPCLPIQVYHGHVQQLIDKGTDWLFIPNLISAATPYKNVNSYYCPWGQTLPFVIESNPAFRQIKPKILNPSLRFRDGIGSVEKALVEGLKPLNVKRKDVRFALNTAYDRLDQFRQHIQNEGEAALNTLKSRGAIGIVIIGRPYNVYDRRLTLNVVSKMREYYGINIVPLDFLPVDSIDISDINLNMYWNYGRKIIAAAKYTRNNPHLYPIYLTNFKCGPDSYIKHYIRTAAGKPFLSLQFDGHSNDAGYITRCEAFLDSIGALRSWRKQSIHSIDGVTQN
jgi:predicted CoA-substrate-specific enzyme activase